MNYMVFDLEFNQDFNFNKDGLKKINSKCPFEIIDIGAVKLDEEFNTISTFSELVKPTIYKRLHPYVKKITGISKESLKAARSFDEVYKDLAQFIRGVDILCVWGTADIKELIRNIEYHNLDSSIVPKKYINVQYYASKQLDSPGKGSIGLGNAAMLMNIPIENQLHRAFNDAFYTGEVFKKIQNQNIEAKIYCSIKNTKPRRGENKKNTLDTDRLMAQFEKMFNREMSSEEQAIIKLAYKMGNTNQFRK
jgi:DNA polymerase III epsilon subunit-like protein